MKENLRNKYDTFVYDNYKINNIGDTIEVTYNYKISEYEFNPKIYISKKNILNKNVDSNFLEYLFFNFGMINAINYYKLTCAKKIIVNAGYLNDEQKEFFKKLFFNGLSELFYINNMNIDYDTFLTIFTKDGTITKFNILNEFDGNIIPVGGGKDSIVTLNLLNKYKDVNKCFLYKRNIYPDNTASLLTIQNFGYVSDDIIEFNVTLDPLMLDLNKNGFINGHVPFSSCLAFAAYIMAYLTNKKYIVLSNESSANEANIIGKRINHQYSKSYEFEKDFRNYTEKYFTKKIQYFSLLRCWNEFQIVKEFVRDHKYLSIFRSCNRGTKTNSWCCDCSKCLYVYIMLSPYLSERELLDIFKINMLDDEKYKDIFLGLISNNYNKPFECVGTKEEINYSLSLCIEKNDKLPFLLKFYKNEIYDKNRTYNIEKFYDTNNFIPKEYLSNMECDENEK